MAQLGAQQRGRTFLGALTGCGGRDRRRHKPAQCRGESKPVDGGLDFEICDLLVQSNDRAIGFSAAVWPDIWR